jgi:polyhydroxyalkanoate synthesis regulator phasin
MGGGPHWFGAHGDRDFEVEGRDGMHRVLIERTVDDEEMSRELEELRDQLDELREQIEELKAD